MVRCLTLKIVKTPMEIFQFKISVVFAAFVHLDLGQLKAIVNSHAR